MKKLKKNWLFLMIIIILLILLCFISIFGFGKVIDFIFNDVNYTAIASISSVVVVIITIISDRKEKFKLIRSNIDSANQLEFERKLFDTLCIYDDLIRELCSFRLEFVGAIDKNSYISRDTISNWYDLSNKYLYLLLEMKLKIEYLYNTNKYSHNELDKLLKDIEDVNSSLNIKLIDFQKLSIDAININGQHFNIQFKSNDAEKMNTINDLYNKANDLINNISDFNNSISSIINNKKNLIYEEAQKAISERESQLIK